MRSPRRAPVRVAVAAVLAVAGGVIAGCTSTPVVLPSRDLDRPTDMAFTCMAVSSVVADDAPRITLGGAPMGNCHPSGVQDQKVGTLDPTGTQYRTYAFVTNSVRGDLSVIDMSYCRNGDTNCWPPGAALVDLDPDLVGYAAAPLGVLPEVVAASQDGCRLVSANRGSCDLTFVNPAVLLTPHVVSTTNATNTTKVTPSSTTPDIAAFATTVVPLHNVAPGEIAFLPQQTGNLPEARKATEEKPVATYCDETGTFAAPVGVSPATDRSVPWRAIVTFPSCDLVAMVDLPSGNLIDSWQVGMTVDDKGVGLGYSFVHSGTNPFCPVTDCGPSAGMGTPPSDAGSSADVTEEAGAGSTDDGGSLDAAGDDATMGGGAAVADGGSAAPRVTVPPTGKLNVNALAIHPDGKHVYFGATNAPFVGVLDVVGDTLVPGAGGAGLPPGSAELHAGAGGATRIRLSVDPFSYSKGYDAHDPSRPEYGRFVAGAHDNQPDDPLEFLYVIARDSSLRVLDVAEGKGLPECDLRIDPNDPNAQAVGADTLTRKACFPYPVPGAGDPSTPAPRRLPSAGGPGQRFGGTPQDIAFANYLTPPPAGSADPNVRETVLNGAFAFVMTTTGAVYILNIDPEVRKTRQLRLVDMATCAAKGGDHNDTSGACAARFEESPRPLTHSFRDASIVTYSTGLGPQSGPPRIDTPLVSPVTGPSLQPFSTWDSSINPLAIPNGVTGVGETFIAPTTGSGPLTYVYFPNRYTVTAQSWAITWEGDLTGVRYTGDLNTTGQLTDNGSGFCALGATDGDTVTLIGCKDTTTCAPGTVCAQGEGVPTSVDGRSISGLCLDQNNLTTLTKECGEFLKTFRRYEIKLSSDRALTIQPKKDEVPRPVYTVNDGERVSCRPDGDDCQPEMDTVHASFKCVEVCSSADPECAVTHRCLQPCGGKADAPCRQGRVCVAFGEHSYCAEAPAMDSTVAKECFPQLVTYKLGAGNGFVVSGGAVGRTEVVVETATPNGPSCTPLTTTLPQLVARIPMNTPLCDSTIDLFDPEKTGQLKDSRVAASTPKPNPCFMIRACPAGAMTGAPCTIKDPGACTLTAGADMSQACTCSMSKLTWTCAKAVPRVSAFFENNEFRFVLGGLEQPVSDLFQIRFEVHGGLSPQLVGPSVDANPGLPARILLGPVPQPEQSMPGANLQPVLEDGTMPFAGQWLSDLPYLFVVDQRQFNGGRLGARGQILRITPRVSDTVPVSQFEGFAAGGQYFPLQ